MIGIVFTNENAWCTGTPFLIAFWIVRWYVSGLCVYGCANELKSPMNEPFDVKIAISVEIASPTSDRPSRPNMNRFAQVQPAAIAAPATTRPITIKPGAIPKMHIPSASKAIDRKLESEMQTDETTPAAGCSVRLTRT